eukprot:CAMPEP_0204175906 /NCGR_PEP_ID=MMETSP0361-20130328/47169_1 /ASSEMBLY_ACC=CAM_ASM_000343 /TAXON_ID=268821 /ORGANISM="Scrippsiella Hangoei, Strain SHTV-5" /LENGTH=485 /DNA_ID=CAMNT_0051134629 /DNA_START=99 /DNA_END=1553 /DNA_ORIENTATION=-
MASGAISAMLARQRAVASPAFPQLIRKPMPSQQQEVNDDWTQEQKAAAFAKFSADQDHNARLATAKALSYFHTCEMAIELPKCSVYGSAIAIPQIARSAGWSGSMVALTLRTYLFLVLNFGLQTFLIAMIGEEIVNWGRYASKMHLCDFAAGAGVEADCGGRPNCVGPGGTNATAARLYDFDIWSLRIFMKQSLETVLPHSRFVMEEVDQQVDPGEWGMSSFYCRIVCCFVFMMGMIDDLGDSLNIMRLMWRLPNIGEHWIRYEVPGWGSKENMKKVHGWDEMDFVKVKIVGMPARWKVLNICIVILPKLALWFFVGSLGFQMLMETAGIVNSIMNALALTLILEMDEMVFDALSTHLTKDLMERLERFEIEAEAHCPSVAREHGDGDADREDEKDEKLLDRFDSEELGSCKLLNFLWTLVPARLIRVVLCMVLFMAKYYVTNCMQQADGGYVSVPMYAPSDIRFHPMHLLFGVPHQPSDKPYWV